MLLISLSLGITFIYLPIYVVVFLTLFFGVFVAIATQLKFQMLAKENI